MKRHHHYPTNNGKGNKSRSICLVRIANKISGRNTKPGRGNRS